MDEKFVRKALEQQGLDKFKQLEGEELKGLVAQTLGTAHYLWRVSPAAVKLVLDDRVRNHLNVFCRLELAGLEAFMIWGRHLQRILKEAGISLDSLTAGNDFGPQMTWLNEVDCMFSVGLASVFFQMRREFAEQKKLVGKRDLYEYVRLPEDEIYGFDRVISGDNPSLALERSNIHQSLYGDPFENMVFRLTRDIISAGGGGSPIDW